MQVRSGARPNGKYIEVTLDEDDVFPDGAGPTTLADKWRSMSKTADTLLVEYMARNGDISNEFAAQRLAEIRGTS